MLREDLTGHGRLAQVLRVLSVLRDARDTSVLGQAVRDCLHGCYRPDLVLELDVTGLPGGQYRLCGGAGKRWESADGQGAPGAVHHGGLLGTIVESPQVQALGRLEVEDDPVLGRLRPACHSLLAVPLPLGATPERWQIFLS